MSDIKYEELQKGDSVVFARVLPKIGYYEAVRMHIVSVYGDYCTGTDVKTKQSFLFSRNLAEKVLFINERLAADYLKKKKIENKDVKIAKE